MMHFPTWIRSKRKKAMCLLEMLNWGCAWPTDSGICHFLKSKRFYFIRIHDSKARGRKRLFSLLVLTHDAASLSVHFDFFLIAMKKMKDVLQV